MKILQINASARSAGANSTRLAAAVTARLQVQNPQASVELRDLASDPHPVQLKTWIDAIARSGVTFRYTANGAEGLAMGAESASQAFAEAEARIEEIFA